MLRPPHPPPQPRPREVRSAITSMPAGLPLQPLPICSFLFRFLRPPFRPELPTSEQQHCRGSCATALLKGSAATPSPTGILRHPKTQGPGRWPSYVILRRVSTTSWSWDHPCHPSVPTHLHYSIVSAPGLTFLDIEMDMVSGQLRLAAKPRHLKSLLQEWDNRKACQRRDPESLIGVLNHPCMVVRCGCTFL